MKRLLVSFTIFLIVFSSFASEKCKIQLSIPNLENTTVRMAFYYDGKIYSNDSIKMDSKGIGILSQEEKLPEGIYLIYFNPSSYFEFLIGADQNILIKADTADLSKVVVSGALESVKFQELIDFRREKQREQADLRQKYIDREIDSLTYISNQKELNEEINTYQNRQIEENEGTFFSKFIKGTVPVEIPLFDAVPDSIKQMTRYQYMKKHYFDHVDLSDPRFLRIPYFPSQVDNFISKNILQVPDSLIEAAFDLIERSKGNDETFRSMLSKMMNYGLNSQLMGMDAVWLAIADRYYLSGQATWADSTWLEDIRKEADKIRHNLIGMQAHNLTVRDSDNRIVQLKDLDEAFVLVYFYDPDCGHCGEITPVLYDSIYTKYKDKGFEVFAVCILNDKEKWQNFVHKYHLTDWKNVWDPYGESRFWEFYDTSVTPAIYLLDKNGRIIAKKIDMHTLEMILESCQFDNV